MTGLELRPLSLGEILDRTFSPALSALSLNFRTPTASGSGVRPGSSYIAAIRYAQYHRALAASGCQSLCLSLRARWNDSRRIGAVSCAPHIDRRRSPARLE